MKIAGRGAAGIYTSPPVAHPPPYVPQAQIKDEVTIASAADLLARRASLINRVWGRNTIDTVEDNVTDTVITTTDVGQLPPGTTVHRYEFDMPTAGGSPLTGGPASVHGLADHFIPNGGSNKLVILNPGHTCRYTPTPFQDAQAVLELLADGYAVLATYMPLYTPMQCIGVYGINPPWRSHNDLFDASQALRPANGADPFIYFLDPVRRTLNYALKKYTYASIAMMGLSGGGWTTTVYAALDTRITTSVPIAGSEPLYMSLAGDVEGQDAFGDGNDFYSVIGGNVVTHYKDLYVLGAYGAGRRQTQVLNRNDDCCYGQNGYIGTGAWERAYELQVRQKLQALGAGAFRVEINEADDCAAIGNCACLTNSNDPSCSTSKPLYNKQELARRRHARRGRRGRRLRHGQRLQRLRPRHRRQPRALRRLGWDRWRLGWDVDRHRTAHGGDTGGRHRRDHRPRLRRLLSRFHRHADARLLRRSRVDGDEGPLRASSRTRSPCPGAQAASTSRRSIRSTSCATTATPAARGRPATWSAATSAPWGSSR
jgi:hypothetical protein